MFKNVLKGAAVSSGFILLWMCYGLSVLCLFSSIIWYFVFFAGGCLFAHSVVLYFYGNVFWVGFSGSMTLFTNVMCLL